MKAITVSTQATDRNPELDISETLCVEEGPGRKGLVGSVLSARQTPPDNLHLSLKRRRFRKIVIDIDGGPGHLNCARDER